MSENREPQCYFCGVTLTDSNSSVEHIIPNALGGRLKSRELLCKKCNSDFGAKSDRLLVNQLSTIASLLQVGRDRGDNQPIRDGVTESNVQYNIEGGRTPVLAHPICEISKDGKSVNIQVNNKHELRRVLNGLKRKYPELDVDRIVDNSEVKEKYLNEPIKHSLHLGGDDVFPALLKIAINFYMLNGGSVNYVTHLFDCINGLETKSNIGHFYPKYDVYSKEKDEVLHIIHLVGDPLTKRLYCYVEFFSTFSYLISLSENYEGDPICETYSYDLLANAAVSKTICLNVSPDDFKFDRRMEFDVIQFRLQILISTIRRKHKQDELNSIIKSCIEQVLGDASGVITQEHIFQLSQLIAHKFVLFINR